MTPALADRFGVDRFIGPIFGDALVDAQVGENRFAMIAGGSAAFEAEYVAVVGHNAAVDALHIAIEVAGNCSAAFGVFGSIDCMVVLDPS